MKHVVMFSGGAGSWATAKRVAAKHGTADLVLLFADTLVEEPDLYRFLKQAAENIGALLVRVADGRTPFEVFRDKRWLGNTRVAHCSKFLKQLPCRQWMEENCPDPAEAIVYVGIDWTETHRVPAIQAGWAPYSVEMPMCESPLMLRHQVIAQMRAEGLEPPASYAEGFPHANCLDQGCVKGGRTYWARILETRRAVYLATEKKEADLRGFLGTNVSILRDFAGGTVRPVTLADFRQQTEAGRVGDLFEWGGCGCFVDQDSMEGQPA